MKKNITERQAFEAMKEFLEQYYKRTNSDDVGSLLGDMCFLDDNNTADPAVWKEWLDCIATAKKKFAEK